MMVCVILLVGLIGLIAALLLLLRSAWERRQLFVEYYRFSRKKTEHIQSGQEQEMDRQGGLRFVFLSDLHSESFGADNERLVAAIGKLSPDAILIGGDMITCGRRTEHAPRTKTCLSLMAALSGIAPVYYAQGNHELRMQTRFPKEHAQFAKQLENLPGLSCLQDSSVIFKGDAGRKEQCVQISGVSLEQSFYDPLPPGFGKKLPLPEGYLKEKTGTPLPGAFHILLLHSPLYLEEAAALGADLVLSGHFHGGTIRLPFIGGLMTPQYQFFVKECAGLFQSGKTRLIVSRGLGTHSIRIRLNNLPEITCVDLCTDD